MMRTIVFGAKGQLGRDLCERFRLEGDVFPADLPELDIADFVAVDGFVREARPDLVVNAAAYTDVEAAEENPASAFRVNETGAANIARASARAGAPVVYYSTDFVFDGEKGRPYTPGDAPAPLCVYGKSKLAGETATRENNDRACIIRTAWLYGPGGNNFVEKILRAAQARLSLTVVEDEVGSPTYTLDLAEATAALAAAGGIGTFHVVNSGACSRYEFARNIVKLAGLDVAVEPCSAGAFLMKAKRPLYSVLSNEKYEKLTGKPMRGWQEALNSYIQRRRQNQ
jgi:dTDP-4-dehydrorhamnose reductase